LFVYRGGGAFTVITGGVRSHDDVDGHARQLKTMSQAVYWTLT